MSLLERIYFFHSRIQANRFPNATELADEFEVSAATAHRDIAYLRDRLLAPLKFDARRNGYYYDETDFRLPFENSPKIVLFLGLLSSMASETGLESLPELQQLQNRLSSLLSRGERIGDLIHCEWVEVQPVDNLVFEQVMGALLEGEQLEITYRKKEDQPPTERCVDPLKMVNYQGRWYLLAWCSLRREKRLFHLSRILELRPTGSKVSHRLETGDNYLTGAFGIFKGRVRFTATIALRGTAAATVRDQHWHPDQEIEETDTGILLRLPVADDRELLMKTLQFGDEAEVLEPPELRKKIKRKINAMASLYS